MSVRYPLLLPLIALLAGIAIGYAGAPLWIAIALIISSIAAAFAISLLPKTPIQALRLSKKHIFWILPLMCGIGILTQVLNRPEILSQQRLEKYRLAEGTVLDVAHKTHGSVYTISLDALINNTDRWHPENLKARIVLGAPDLRKGDRIIFEQHLQPMQDVGAPFESPFSDLPRRRNILYTQNLDTLKTVTTLRDRNLTTICEDLSSHLLATLRHSSLRPETQEFIAVILLGRSDLLLSDTRRDFSEAGLSHILALSGLHIGIIAAMLLFLLRPLNLLGSRHIRTVAVVLLLWAYTLITGMSGSAVRATLMATFMSVALITQSANNGFNSLCGALMVILLISPAMIFEPSLQLSAASVAAICLLVPRLNPFDPSEHRRMFNIGSAMLASLAAIAASLPISAYYFGIIPLAALPLSLIVLPLLPAYISVAAIYLIFLCFGFDSRTLMLLTEIPHKALTGIVDFLSGASPAALEVSVGGIVAILFLAALAIFAVALETSKENKPRLRKALALSSLVIFVAAAGMQTSGVGADRFSGIVFHRQHGEIALSECRDGNRETYRFPRGEISELTLQGVHILCIDTPRMPETFAADFNRNPDYLIVGPSYQGTIAEIAAGAAPKTLVLHNDIHHTRIETFLRECSNLKLNHYNLKHNGSLVAEY